MPPLGASSVPPPCTRWRAENAPFRRVRRSVTFGEWSLE
jgi:hypothetical protein